MLEGLSHSFSLTHSHSFIHSFSFKQTVLNISEKTVCFYGCLYHLAAEYFWKPVFLPSPLWPSAEWDVWIASPGVLLSSEESLSSLRTYYTLKLHLFFQSKSTDIFSERVHMPDRMLPVSPFTAITLVFVILSVPSTSFCCRDRS